MLITSINYHSYYVMSFSGSNGHPSHNSLHASNLLAFMGRLKLESNYPLFLYVLWGNLVPSKLSVKEFFQMQ